VSASVNLADEPAEAIKDFYKKIYWNWARSESLR
jgi:hypothetical protein